jgi:nuclear pore complex protein Nup98-Nup96
MNGLIVEPDLWSMTETELSCVKELCVAREGVGSVTFHGETDCRGLAPLLTKLVVLNAGEVVVYPDQAQKPAPGKGLNKPARIVLHGCLPKTQGFRDRKSRDRYKRRVRQMTEDKGAEFIDYDCEQGIWTFRVSRF